MIANLMMYARPELEEAHANYWNGIRQQLTAVGIDSPENLSQSAEEFFVWRHPQLVLSQTCGMPYRKLLHSEVQLAGTPDYALDGCTPGYYRSAIIVHADDKRTNLLDFRDAVFAYNQKISQSGFASMYSYTRQHGFWFNNLWQSHSHLNSAKAVAEKRAGIAAIDAVTWRLIKQYEPSAESLQVLDWTQATPGLPYITSNSMDAETIFSAVESAIINMRESDRVALGIKSLIRIPAEDYLAVQNPPDQI